MITAENPKLIFANTVFNFVNLAILGQVAKITLLIFSSDWVLQFKAIYETFSALQVADKNQTA